MTTMLVQRRRELGGKKALGFTNAELGRQTRWTILPAVGVGAGLGAVLGGVLMAPLLAALLRGIGILKVELTTNWLQVGGIAALILAFALVMTWLVSLRIRRVSAYALMTD